MVHGKFKGFCSLSYPALTAHSTPNLGIAVSVSVKNSSACGLSLVHPFVPSKRKQQMERKDRSITRSDEFFVDLSSWTSRNPRTKDTVDGVLPIVTILTKNDSFTHSIRRRVRYSSENVVWYDVWCVSVGSRQTKLRSSNVLVLSTFFECFPWKMTRVDKQLDYLDPNFRREQKNTAGKVQVLLLYPVSNTVMNTISWPSASPFLHAMRECNASVIKHNMHIGESKLVTFSHRCGYFASMQCLTQTTQR